MNPNGVDVLCRYQEYFPSAGCFFTGQDIRAAAILAFFFLLPIRVGLTVSGGRSMYLLVWPGVRFYLENTLH
jgi:hypothetical protein